MPVNVVAYTPPNGNIAPVLNGARFCANFSTTAQFGGAPLANGEYRQYVMGTFVANGSTLTHYLCSGDPMLANAYKEDGCLATCTAYGHRSCPSDPIDRYTPQQADGPNFAMSDAPGFNNVRPGVTYAINLTFKGDLIDTSTPQAAPMRTSSWTVNGQVTTQATTTTTRPSPQGLQSSDKVVSAHFSLNLESKAREVHVVVSRLPDQPAIEPEQLPFTLTTDSEVAVTHAEVNVYEIADKFGATANIVYALDAKQPAPAKVRLVDDLAVPGLAIGAHP
jgi:hypothetical protein